MNLPELSQAVFIGLMVVLQIADAWTTYDAIRLGGTEAHPINRKLMEWLGLREAIWLIKIAVIAYIVIWPITDPRGQWLNLAIFAGVSLNNFRILLKLKKAKGR